MSKTPSFIDLEISNHHTSLDGWISGVDTLEIVDSFKSVVERFKRDCVTLKQDMDNCQRPTTADFNDFVDRRNSLEIQFHNLCEQFSDS